MSTRWKLPSGPGRDRGFTLVELFLAMLVLGVLCAVAAPIYLGYSTDAKITEGKMLAGALWTAVQAGAISSCGTDFPVSSGYPKAGLSSSGQAASARWSVTAGGENTISTDCASGLHTVSSSPLFVIKGDGVDVSGLRVQLAYAAGGTPPSQLQCSKDDGGTFTNC
jgi:prepilin-type N-terminal cleavage/methylation domain-containing protein